MRVIVAPADVAPVSIAHPALFQPKADAGAAARARAAEAEKATKKADEARLAVFKASREAAQAMVPVRVAENLKLRAEAHILQDAKRGTKAMKIGRKLALSAVGLAASISASLAGTCSAEIDAIMARINTAVEARAGAGTGAKEQATVGGRHIQPTPRSLAAAEEKRGEISADTIEQITQAMERARAADRAGDNVACNQRDRGRTCDWSLENVHSDHFRAGLAIRSIVICLR